MRCCSHRKRCCELGVHHLKFGLSCSRRHESMKTSAVLAVLTINDVPHRFSAKHRRQWMSAVRDDCGQRRYATIAAGQDSRRIEYGLLVLHGCWEWLSTRVITSQKSKICVVWLYQFNHRFGKRWLHQLRFSTNFAIKQPWQQRLQSPTLEQSTKQAGMTL